MDKIADATFTGASGTQYSFAVYPLNTSFGDVGAVYIFTKRTATQDNGTHKLLYIGESGELGTRISNHEKLPCVNQHGGNCICVHGDNSQDSRRNKESDLISHYDPPCND
jgi:hypothetical protein